MLDVRPAQYWPEDVPEAAAADLSTLHAAIRACQPVSFGYIDLSGNETARTVLPLALVHPPQGVNLLSPVWPAHRRDRTLRRDVHPNVPDARTPRRIVQTGCSSTNLKKIAPQAWRITFIAFSRAAFAKTS